MERPGEASLDPRDAPALGNVAVVGYRIFQQQGTAPATQIGTSTGTSFTVTGLATATSYSFFVRAVDPGGNISASSNTVAVTTSTGGTGVTPSVAVTNDWGTGYCATLTVTNNTASAVTWQVTFAVRGTINNLWNGTFTQSGGSATVSGVSWNAVLQPGQSTNSVGFCAQL